MTSKIEGNQKKFGSPVLDALEELAKEQFPKNPSKSKDLGVCPHCRCELFYLCEGTRLFCSGCKSELRINTNFLGGKLLQ